MEKSWAKTAQIGQLRQRLRQPFGFTSAESKNYGELVKPSYTAHFEIKRETLSLKVGGVVGGRRYFKKIPTGSLFVSSRQFSLALSLRVCRSSALTA